jgi:hypothetical protein
LYFNKYLRGKSLTLEQGKPKQLALAHLLLDAKLQEQRDKEELPASAFLFEMLTSY